MLEKLFITSKAAMRDIILARRKAQKPVSLINEINFSEYQNIYIYESLPGEVQTDKFIRGLIANGKRVFVPKDERFTPLDSGKMEPPNLIIVPALAYSKTGDRLGRGGGWYDKFLCKYPDVKKIGVIPEEFLFDNLPTEAHDVKVDEVIVIGESANGESEV